MFRAQTVLTVSWIYTYLQTHQAVYINYVRLLVCPKKVTVRFLGRAEQDGKGI